MRRLRDIATLALLVAGAAGPVASASAAAGFAVVVAGDVSAGARANTTATTARSTSTAVVSRSTGGGAPNGSSTNAVMSNDKRFVRVIAFESEASNLVSGDRNGMRDVFVTLRGNRANDQGTPWKPGRNILISRTASGAPSNGPSYDPVGRRQFPHDPHLRRFPLVGLEHRLR